MFFFAISGFIVKKKPAWAGYRVKIDNEEMIRVVTFWNLESFSPVPEGPFLMDLILCVFSFVFPHSICFSRVEEWSNSNHFE